MKKTKPTYQSLEKRLAAAEPIVAALQRHEVDAVVGEEKIAFLLLRKVEEAWLESNGEFSAMFNLDGIGMIQAKSPAFRLTRVNSKFCEITGYSAEELLTKTYLELTDPQDRQRGLKELSKVVRGLRNSWSIEKRCVCKDKRVIWTHVHGVALRDHAGQLVMIMAMIEDITARKQAEQRQQDDQIQMKQQLQKRTDQMTEMLRLLRNLIARRKPADQVLRSIHDFIDRYSRPGVATSSVGGGQSMPRKKATPEKDKKSSRRIPSKKPWSTSR